LVVVVSEPGLTLPGPHLHVAGRAAPAFWLFGLTGIAAAVAAAVALSAATGISTAAQLAICAAAIATLAALWWIEGRRFVYFHHHLAVLLVAGVLAAALGQSVLGHLDATAAGLGVFLAFGRVGCLLAGCCHGRPAERGVLYGEAHVAHGLPAWLAGITLIPVQALESGGVALLAVAAGAAALGGPAGAGFVVYSAGYAVLRFFLEPLRGDLGRPSRRCLSEAQWTALAIAAGTAAMALAGTLPWPLVPVAGLVAIAAGIVALARPGRRRPVLGPEHVREMLLALGPATPPAASAPPRVTRTSCGVLVSSGWAGGRPHYTFSGSALGRRPAAVLARAILWQLHPGFPAHLVTGPAGVYHVVVDP
jgi:prolipoprotein diacylglyceryltransferase